MRNTGNSIHSWFLGPDLVKDLQTPSPSKRAIFIFLSKYLHNVLKRMSNQFSNFCDIYFLSYNWFWYKIRIRWNVLKRNDICVQEFFCAIFSFWDIVHFVFNNKLERPDSDAICASFWLKNKKQLFLRETLFSHP